MIKITSLFLALGILSGCGATNPATPAKVYDLSHLKPTNHKAMVIKRIKIDLKDPDSAKIKVGELKLITCNPYGGPTANGKMKMWSADALVNARNSFGAYTGDKVRRYYFDKTGIVGLTDLYIKGHSETCIISNFDALAKKAK